MNMVFEIYTNYYLLTEETFFTLAQKAIILKLVAGVHGIDADTEEYARLAQTVAEIDSRPDLKTSVGCSNWLFLNAFSPKVAEKEWIEKAVTAKLQVLLQRCSYPSSFEWYRAMQEPQMNYEFAIYEYATGNLTGALERFKVLSSDDDLRATEVLAYLFYDMGDCEQALYYSIMVRHLCNKIHFAEKAWITRSIQKLQTHFTPQQIELMQKKASQPNYAKKIIGFTSQL